MRLTFPKRLGSFWRGRSALTLAAALTVAGCGYEGASRPLEPIGGTSGAQLSPPTSAGDPGVEMAGGRDTDLADGADATEQAVSPSSDSDVPAQTGDKDPGMDAPHDSDAVPTVVNIDGARPADMISPDDSASPKPIASWTQFIRTHDNDFIANIAFGPHREAYVVGTVEEHRNMFNELESIGVPVYTAITMYDSGGAFRWAVVDTQPPGPTQHIYAVVVDATDNLYVAGGTPRWTTEHGQKPDDAFVLKYSPTGERLWLATTGTTGSDSVAALAVDRESNVYVTGSAGENHASSSSAAPTGIDGAPYVGPYFVAKYDVSGTLQWIRGAEQGGSSIAIDQGGDIYVAGNLAVAKYDSAGTLHWVQNELPDPGMYAGSSVTTSDEPAQVYVTHGFTSVDRSGSPHSTNYLSCIDSLGRTLWRRVVTGESAFTLRRDAGLSLWDGQRRLRFGIDGSPIANDRLVSNLKFDDSGLVSRQSVVTFDPRGNVYLAGSVEGIRGRDPDVKPTWDGWVSVFSADVAWMNEFDPENPNP